ncbi:MAG TPA: clostripain-related cysteine peptidase [bacterium]|nr:clostripain-related cysteine peptidase [bacterium]
MRKFIFILFLFVFFSFFSEATISKWTIMIYLDGDNNLEEYALDDFLEMSEISSDENVNIVVQFDRISRYDSSYGNWTGCNRFYVTKGIEPTEENAISNWGDGKGEREVNMGDPETLANFILWAKENYPAEKYTLILWNHGGGWRDLYQSMYQIAGKEIPVLKEVCYDDTDGDYLSTNEVRQAIENAGGVDLIGFDACLMGMIEVAYELSPFASVMVASEEVEPASGWDYVEILSELKAQPLSTSEEFGEIIVNSYSYDTLSAISLINIQQLIDSLNYVLDEIMSSDIYLDIYLVRSETKNFDELTYIDLYDFFNKLYQTTENETLKSKIEEFQDIFKQTVFSDNEESDNSYGLSIYFPDYGEVIAFDYNGETISFPESALWDEFLSAFLTSDLFSSFTLVFSEDFSSGIPVNWTIVDGYNDGKTWTYTNPGRRNLDLNSPFMIVDSDWAGTVDMDEELITPSIDFTSYATCYLEFKNVFEYYENEIGDVDIKIGNGQWQNLKKFKRQDIEGKVIIDLTSISSGEKNVQIRWHYYNANWDWYWAVDDIKIYGKLPGKGDVDKSGGIDISDVILCLRMAIELDPLDTSLADINGDGEVDITDVILILRRVVGLT